MEGVGKRGARAHSLCPFSHILPFPSPNTPYSLHLARLPTTGADLDVFVQVGAWRLQTYMAAGASTKVELRVA